MENQILTELSARLQGLWYMSESEAPLTPQSLGNLRKDQLDEKITGLFTPESSSLTLNKLDPAVFFNDIVAAADPADQIIVQNAAKFTELYAYLKNNSTDINVFRLEGESNIPIIITSLFPDGEVIAISTYSIET